MLYYANIMNINFNQITNTIVIRFSQPRYTKHKYVYLYNYIQLLECYRL